MSLETEAFPLGCHFYYGMRRVDGQPWRSTPSAPGLYDYYSISEVGESNGELSRDAMVFICGHAEDLIQCVYAQREKDPAVNVACPGDVIPMKTTFSNGRMVFADMTPEQFEAIVMSTYLGMPDWIRHAREGTK